MQSPSMSANTSKQLVQPSVGIIYSDNAATSLESKNSAYYFAGMLATSGYSNIYLPGYALTTPIEAPVSCITNETWAILPKCDLILVTVNSNDTSLVAKKLIECLAVNNSSSSTSSKKVPVVSLQRGVKNSALIKEELTGNCPSACVIEGVVGYAVVTANVINNKTYSFPVYVPTVGCSTIGIAIERIPKEIIDYVDGPMGLIEVLPGFQYYYRKVLTTVAWGTVVYDNVNAVNALTGGSLLDTIRSHKARVLLASMLRECRLALGVAARGGAWKPDLMLPLSTTWFMFFPYINQLWCFEMMLLLPTFIYYILYMDVWYFNIPRSKEVVSPLQLDLLSYRESNCKNLLDELIASGRRHDFDMSVCEAVSHSIHQLEQKKVKYENKSFHLEDVLKIENDLLNGIEKSNEATKSTPISVSNTRCIKLGYESHRELSVVCFKCGAILGFIFLCFYVLFNIEIELPEAEINL